MHLIGCKLPEIPDEANRITFIQKFEIGLGAATELIELKDRGFALVGQSGFAARVDKDGVPMWQDQYAQSGINFVGISQNDSGDIFTLKNEYGKSPSLVKITLNGGAIPSKYIFDPIGDSSFSASDITLSKDGNYLILGSVDFDGSPGTATDNRFFLVEMDYNSISHTSYFGYSASSTGGEIYYVPYLGVVFSGTEHRISSPSNYSSIYVLDESGQKNSYSFSDIRFNIFAPLSDGNFAVLSTPFNNNLWIWKLTPPDNWSLGIPIPIDDDTYDEIEGAKIIERREGGFAGVANVYTYPNDKIKTGLFFIIDTDGSFLHYELIGQSWTTDGLYSIIQTRDGGYAMVGSINGDPVLIKTDAKGNVD